jgi:rubrerythrin
MIAVAGAAIVLATLPAASAGRSLSFASGLRTNRIRAGQLLAVVGHRPVLPAVVRARGTEELVERGVVELHGGSWVEGFGGLAPGVTGGAALNRTARNLVQLSVESRRPRSLVGAIDRICAINWTDDRRRAQNIDVARRPHGGRRPDRRPRLAGGGSTSVLNPRRCTMKSLKGTKTHDNLKAAFAGESQANRRYLYFANKADVEGQNDVAALFRSTAEGETGHAHGHLDYIAPVGDPATDLPIGSSRQNLKAAVAGETHEYTDMYPGMAKAARDEGFDEIADWFETLAKAERSHANRFQKALDALAD